MQRTIAEQLELPSPVMDMLDVQDEEDDYQGLDKSSRTEIPQVAEVIYQHVQKLVMNRRFLVIFHNGSSEEIDLDSFGFPLSGYSKNKVLWTFQGRFRLYPRTKVDRALKSTRTMTNVLVSAAWPYDNMSDILLQEAAEVAHDINVSGIEWPEAAANCLLYIMRLRRMASHLVDYDLTTHSCNYWKCDGILQLKQGDDGADKLWLSSDALQREMRLDAEYYQNPCLQSLAVMCLPEHIPSWSSPTYGFMLIPEACDKLIPKGMFQRFNNVSVLKLSACRFSFTSPPFLCCHSLRFLWLDNCQDESSSSTDEAGNEEDIRRCFQRLWVLDMRYSSSTFLSAKMMDFMTQLRELNVMGERYLDMDLFKGRLHNTLKLRVTKSNYIRHNRWDCSSGRDKMELLDLSGSSRHVRSLYAANCSSLETIIIDGSISLKEIFLKGCAKLKNLILSGLFPQLHRLDITGTALHMDITEEGSTTAAAAKARSARGCSWYVSVRDARQLWLLVPVKDYFSQNVITQVIVTTSPTSQDDARDGNSSRIIKSSSGHVQQQLLNRLKDNAIYTDVAATNKGKKSRWQEASEGGSSDNWVPYLPRQCCYLHIEDHMKRSKQQTASLITMPGFICDNARFLHVHDSLFVRGIIDDETLLGSRWNQLKQCNVVRCPKLECVFNLPLHAGQEERSSRMGAFGNLGMILASHLPNARCIVSRGYIRRASSFGDLTGLYLYCCPRLEYAVPCSSSLKLKTLEIMWCGDLSVVFPFEERDKKDGQLYTLEHIHLHEVPKLQAIAYGTGFWNRRSWEPAECNCEKEWWDRLKWDSRVQSKQYKPIHPRYYKKTMLRGSPLR
ncbi:unnamed protein product [Urochloa decumbens]|uniref:Uncharacterized protein n=1 Tax=Urochloa decumbens TaxID=240449 RepID=A0ABC9B5J9_9POAL